MKRSYDFVANVYDQLALFFIGKPLRRAQTEFLYFIPPGASILLVGGGTGWILEEIAKHQPSGLQIDYVDVSGKMISLARRRNWRQNEVRFFQKSILDFESHQQYDVIITFFFWDNFKEETVNRMFPFLHTKLKINGYWLYADFQIRKHHAYWQKPVLFAMYSFFRIACGIETMKLPNMINRFAGSGYSLSATKTFLKQFIVSSVYKKQLHK